MATYPEMWFIYIWVVPRFGAGVREAWRKNRAALISILLVVTPLIVSYALKTAVSGEAIRMRSQFVPILLIFAGIGHAVYERRKAARKRRIEERRNFAARYIEQDDGQDIAGT
jgi:glucan phosphoethanolaminetransferase (alkaline phosphatase superfamily)